MNLRDEDIIQIIKKSNLFLYFCNLYCTPARLKIHTCITSIYTFTTFRPDRSKIFCFEPLLVIYTSILIYSISQSCSMILNLKVYVHLYSVGLYTYIIILGMLIRLTHCTFCNFIFSEKTHNILLTINQDFKIISCLKNPGCYININYMLLVILLYLAIFFSYRC